MKFVSEIWGILKEEKVASLIAVILGLVAGVVYSLLGHSAGWALFFAPLSAFSFGLFLWAGKKLSLPS